MPVWRWGRFWRSTASTVGRRYLGTVKVTDAFNLYPKQAVVKFTPASGKPLSRLRPEELPHKGDRVHVPSDAR